MILELPHEASPQTRLNIMLDFTKQMFRDREIPFWCALHSPIPGVNDPRNYHAHIVYIGRPARIIDHHEKVTITRKGETVVEGAAIREWDFAAPVINNRWGMRKVIYPHRRKNDERLRNRTQNDAADPRAVCPHREPAYADGRPPRPL